MRQQSESDQPSGNQEGASARPAPVTVPPPAALLTDPITAEWVASLGKNSYARFAPRSAKLAMIAVERNSDGHECWKQYPDLVGLGEQFRPITGTVTIENGERVRAETPNGTELSGVSERALQYELTGPEGMSRGTLIPTSPTSRAKAPGHTFPVYANARLNRRKSPIKRQAVQVNADDMAWRQAQGPVRKPIQKNVMGNTAVEAIRLFILMHHASLSPRALKLLNTANHAEWLHLVAYSLTPRAMNPQVKANLVAG